jgi:ribokinase
VRVAVVGSINADLVLRVPTLPVGGVTMPATDLRRLPGGKGANQAVALARLGAEVAMVGAVGDDDDGRWLLRVLRDEGIDVDAVAVLADAPTGLAVVVVDDAAENAIVVVPGANAAVTTSGAAGALSGAAAVLMQLEIPTGAVAAAAGLGRAAAATVVLNAAPAVSLPDEVLSLVDVLIVNASEAHALAGAGNPEACAARLRARGPSKVVVTMGAEGVVIDDGNAIHLPAFPVEALDTTGAGDCFAAAFTHAIAGGQTAAAAARYASAAAAIAVTRAGAQSMPTRDEVAAFLAAH